MTFKTLLLTGASVALLGACAAPNEYNTYETGKIHNYEPEAQSEGSSWMFWRNHDNKNNDVEVIETDTQMDNMQEDDVMMEPVVIIGE